MGKNIYKRKDTGVWEFRKVIKGVKYYQSIPEARTRLQAEVAASKIIRDIYEGKYGKEGGEVGAYDFKKFVDEIYLPSVKDHLRQPQETQYVCGVLVSFFHNKRLRDISQIEIEKFRKARLTGTIPIRVTHERPRSQKFYRPCKPITVKGNIVVLSGILNFAIDNDYALSNPCRRIKWKAGQVVKSRGRIPTPEELDALLSVIEGETRTAVLLTLNTGIRKSGLLGLTVDDPNFQARALRYTAKGGKRKVVPINDRAIEILRELVKNSPDGFLFRGREGYFLSDPRGAFKTYCKQAGISGLNFHDLRRLFAMRVEQLARSTTVRDLLGHSNIKVTSEHYLPENWEAMKKAVNELSETDFHGCFAESPGKVLQMR